tara:strand:- start:69 stop:494 length:426 start_codon:yes stop_codon:yes gene_type:complete
MTRTFIPVNDALKALAAAGHEVAKPSRKQDRVAGFGGPHYLVDGEWLSLSSVRAMVADLGLEKSTKTAADKPRREIEVLAEAVAQNEFCQRKQIVISVFGCRNFNGQVVYSLYFVNKEGERKTCKKTLSWIRDYCKRNGVI